MRNFINIVHRLFEAKVVSRGLWTKVSANDLQRLAATRHLRGWAVQDEVFVWPAYDETHYGMTNELGIQENEGIPFFVHSSAPKLVGSHGGDDPAGDWSGDGAGQFVVGSATVVVSAESVAEIQTNRGFCRMVGLPVPNQPQAPRAPFEPEIMQWMDTNGWDYETAQDFLADTRRWPWDCEYCATDGSFTYDQWRAMRA